MKKILISVAILSLTLFGTVYADTLKEGQSYKISELNTNTSTSTRIFKTEGYLVQAQNKNDCPKCPLFTVCNYYCPNSAIFSEIDYSDKNVEWNDVLESKTMRTVLVRESGIDNAGSLKLGSKYILELKIQNIGTILKPNNHFEIVSIKNVDGTAVNVIKEPVSPTLNKGALSRIWAWITNLF